MDVFVARHPIFDAQKRVTAYALEFRDGFQSYYQSLQSGKDQADLLALVSFGELTDGKRGFVTFSPGLLDMDFAEVLPRDLLAVGIGACTGVDDQVLGACRKLKDAGYTLSVADTALGGAGQGLIELADYIEVDFLGTSPQQRSALMDCLAPHGRRTVARTLSSDGDFQQAIDLGCTLFEGDFFARPQVKPQRELAPGKLTCLRLLNEVHRPDLFYDDLEALIKQDTALTYKLMRFMNSAWMGLRYEVNSIRHALILLGPKEIKQWVSVVLVKDMSGDKPRELLLRSLSRARAAELIAPLAGMEPVAGELFLMGMFSVIDALVDRPMDDVLADLPVNAKIKSALLAGTGEYRGVYDALIAYETGDWSAVDVHCNALGVSPSALPEIFRDSLKWAGSALEQE